MKNLTLLALTAVCCTAAAQNTDPQTQMTFGGCARDAKTPTFVLCTVILDTTAAKVLTYEEARPMGNAFGPSGQRFDLVNFTALKPPVAGKTNTYAEKTYTLKKGTPVRVYYAYNIPVNVGSLQSLTANGKELARNISLGGDAGLRSLPTTIGQDTFTAYLHGCEYANGTTATCMVSLVPAGTAAQSMALGSGVTGQSWGGVVIRLTSVPRSGDVVPSLKIGSAEFRTVKIR